jgi:hypothetical protein
MQPKAVATGTLIEVRQEFGFAPGGAVVSVMSS